jgi:PPK2 family polyphosphate:nucleotide phosphotransferase
MGATMKKNYFEIASDEPLSLKKMPTKVEPKYKTETEYQKILDQNHALLGDYQTKLYASHSKSVLLVLQGMDTSGKDGAIKHVMSGVNPQGCHVVSFKAPTATELDHDFLWRVNCALPPRGQIGIFNRSYYEEVLVTQIHPEILDAENLPTGTKYDKSFWKHRYNDIVHHEQYLSRQGYEVIKIFIHISKAEQKLRLEARFQDPKKHWKISEGDIRERSFWKEYQEAYEECIKRTSTENCPWYIVPGDDKKNARLSISQILADRLENMNLEFPKLNAEQKQKLKNLKAQLAAEG